MADARNVLKTLTFLFEVAFGITLARSRLAAEEASILIPVYEVLGSMHRNGGASCKKASGSRNCMRTGHPYRFPQPQPHPSDFYLASTEKA